MNNQELSVNIAILEHRGWFIAEDETDEDAEGFEVLLLCCRPDGTTLEKVPVSPFLLSLYEEEDGSLEERLWFFAPKYSTSLDNMRRLLEEGLSIYEWSVSRWMLVGEWQHTAKVRKLEQIQIVSEGVTADVSSVLALARAYLKCEGVHANYNRGNTNN